jgi:8-oxo-dGTP pyrophosphatase MutT (NUDIX family)
MRSAAYVFSPTAKKTDPSVLLTDAFRRIPKNLLNVMSFNLHGTEKMNEVHVVTVLLFHKGKIALVKRSASVGTYQGFWSGISGYLEGDPNAHFLTEIREETGLNPKDVILLRTNKPLRIEDKKLKRAWMVHPFLCKVKNPHAIKLDWENLEIKWIAPSRIQRLKTVPGLFEVWESISPNYLNREVNSFVGHLKKDKKSGARQLALESLKFVLKICAISNAACKNVLLEDIHYALEKILTARPSMIAVATAMELLKKEIDHAKFPDISIEKTKVLATKIIKQHIQQMEKPIDKSLSNLKTILRPGRKY